MTKKRATTTRKVAAVLAGGLVLGIGAATTLAAWTDSQQATATFTAGTFKLVSSVDGASWADHPQGDPAILAVGTPGMSPGVSGFGYLDVKTSAASTLDGTVMLEAATAGTASDEVMVSALEFRAMSLAAGTTCDAAALEPAEFLPVTNVPDVRVQTIQAAGKSSVRYCLEVRMVADADAAVQGKTANMIWTVQGTSS